MTNYSDKIEAIKIVKEYIKHGLIEDRLQYSTEDIMFGDDCSNAVAMIVRSHLGVITMHGESRWLDGRI